MSVQIRLGLQKYYFIMETRNIAITIKKAKEWYYSSNQSLKEVALQAFSKEELEAIHFSKITCFEDVCSVLGLNYTKEINTYNKIATVSKASAASYKLNLTRKALNLGQEMSLLEGKIWCPYTLFVAEGNSYNRSCWGKEVAKFKYNGDIYRIFLSVESGSTEGLSSFDSYSGASFSHASDGFLGCATKEITQHFGTYFVREIFEAKYGDLIDYTWI